MKSSKARPCANRRAKPGKTLLQSLRQQTVLSIDQLNPPAQKQSRRRMGLICDAPLGLKT